MKIPPSGIRILPCRRIHRRTDRQRRTWQS